MIENQWRIEIWNDHFKLNFQRWLFIRHIINNCLHTFFRKFLVLIFFTEFLTMFSNDYIIIIWFFFSLIRLINTKKNIKTYRYTCHLLTWDVKESIHKCDYTNNILHWNLFSRRYYSREIDNTDPIIDRFSYISKAILSCYKYNF